MWFSETAGETVKSLMYFGTCVLSFTLVFIVLSVVAWFCLQLSPKGMVSIEELKEKWKNLCLPEEQLEAILQLDVLDEEVEWMKILARGCSVLGEVCSQQEPSGPAPNGHV